MNIFKAIVNKITSGKVKAKDPSAARVKPAAVVKAETESTRRALSAQATFRKSNFQTLGAALEYILNPMNFIEGKKQLERLKDRIVANSSNPDKEAVRKSLEGEDTTILYGALRLQPEIAIGITGYITDNMPELVALMAKEAGDGRIPDETLEALSAIFDIAKEHKDQLSNPKSFPHYSDRTYAITPNPFASEQGNVENAVYGCAQVALGELSEFVRVERDAHRKTVELNTKLIEQLKKYNAQVEALKEKHDSIITLNEDIAKKHEWLTQFNECIEDAKAEEEDFGKATSWFEPASLNSIKTHYPEAETDILHYIAMITTFANANNLVAKSSADATVYDDIALTFDASVPPIQLVKAILKKSEGAKCKVYSSGSITDTETDPTRIKTNTIILTEQQAKLMQEVYARLSARAISDTDATTYGLAELKKVAKNTSFEETPFVVKQELYKYILAERDRRIAAARSKSISGTALTAQEQQSLKQYSQFYIQHLMAGAIIDNSAETQAYIEQKARRNGVRTLTRIIEDETRAVRTACSEYTAARTTLIATRTATNETIGQIEETCRTRRYAKSASDEMTAVDSVKMAVTLPCDFGEGGVIREEEVISAVITNPDGSFAGFDRDIVYVETAAVEPAETALKEAQTSCETTLSELEKLISETYTALDSGKPIDHDKIIEEILRLSEDASLVEGNPLSQRVCEHTQAITELVAIINQRIYENDSPAARFDDEDV